MQKETVTFDKLPEAVGYLTEQVIELKKMVAELQPPTSDKHVLVEIEDACRILRKKRNKIMVFSCLHAINSNYICIVELLLQKNKKLENRYSLFCQTIT